MEATLWPWLAVAAAGALHGLNPCGGWALAAAGGGVRAALLPLALGHAASAGLVAGLVAAGLPLAALPWLAAPGLAGLLLAALGRRRAALALCGFGMASLQGSGLMLVPALVPLCLGAAPAREIIASGSLPLALAALLLHLGAMLAATALAALLARGGWQGVRRRWRGRQPGR